MLTPEASGPGLQASFKPGISTWNTDNPEQQPWLARQAKKQKGGAGKEAAAPAAISAPAPLPYSSSAKLVQRQQTTGAFWAAGGACC